MRSIDKEKPPFVKIDEAITQVRSVGYAVLKLDGVTIQLTKIEGADEKNSDL